MSLDSELLEHAKDLLGREPRRPRQASLRRAVSAAYYALFHLLIYEASSLFVKDEDAIGMIARSYTHGRMLEISKRFSRGDLPQKLHPYRRTLNDPARKPIVEKLKSIAQTFIDTQQARHEADYNLRKSFSRSEVKELVELVETAMADWKLIRKDDLARIYLACFLVFDDWNKDR